MNVIAETISLFMIVYFIGKVMDAVLLLGIQRELRLSRWKRDLNLPRFEDYRDQCSKEITLQSNDFGEPSETHLTRGL